MMDGLLSVLVELLIRQSNTNIAPEIICIRQIKSCSDHRERISNNMGNGQKAVYDDVLKHNTTGPFSRSFNPFPNAKF